MMHDFAKRREQCTKWGQVAFIFLSSLLLTQSAYAAVGVNLATMIENLATTIPDLMQLTTAISYVMGFFFIFNGILHLKKYGEHRSMMSTDAHLRGPLIWLAVGAGLIYLPSSVQSGFYTFWSNPNPYQYMKSDTPNEWQDLINACYMVIQLIGTIAFIRGLVLFTHLGGHGGQQGSFGKAMAHVVGGIFCIDIYDFVNSVLNTLALGQT